ncbi:MAG: ATP-binding cassette domain-containing protein, partial [Lachnospiraceae bacterium]|nr:ATP-binding cassette domain-containing protein [Lachnospiraceae bacterium]
SSDLWQLSDSWGICVAGRVALTSLPLLLMLMEELFGAAVILVGNRTAKARCTQAIERMEKVTAKSLDIRSFKKAEKNLALRERLKDAVTLPANKKGEKDTEKNTENLMVGLRNVSKRYREKVAVSNVSLKIGRGEHILLQGENGAGKSTLLRLLVGLEEPDEGTVERLVSEIVFLFQEEPVFHLTVRELMTELIQTRIVDGDVLMENLKVFHIDDILDSFLDECSGGQRKKFYLSLAFARGTSFLVLDEPTNHLDPEGVSALCEILQRTEAALLICTHDKRLSCFGDRVCEMKEGVLYER